VNLFGDGMSVDWGQVALVVGVLVPSVILHEVSHGVVALWFGDDTAKRAGRLTLNPVPHVDPVGTLLLPLLLSLGGLGAFGYAKPVPVNTRNLRDPRRHALWVSLVGPAVNIVLAVVAGIAFHLLFRAARQGDTIYLDGGLASEVVFTFGFVNVILAAFNLLPVPPLDGSAVVERLLPATWLPQWRVVRRSSMGVLLLVVLLVPGALSRVFEPAIRLWARLL
jgi:Zn-dependent protease